ncbi:pyocin activator PrtN family protein [Grimontia sp. NTOU-MAR1]|uniref:pyocin activator PrtN family protein n=1 Tax=Grimontia sp. NTOU-MAR1 TaxID=3111011 RepID=UPI002DBB1C24|nr:pyocin activator PrtN family protein [Grimontia sp. NTOU-MAR1]WRV96384.1 pyocin activator PrtN family protein [Grimontia sp. NTOU-MAR1]
MNTQFALLARFESPTIPLKHVCVEFFGIQHKTAEAQAKSGEFPIPTFKMRNSERSPTLVHIEDLAKHIDAQLTKAREEWASVNNTGA